MGLVRYDLRKLIIFAAPLLLTACLKDLRPRSIQEPVVPVHRKEKADQLLTKMADAHGGMETFAAGKTSHIIFRDYWPSTFFRWLAMPWEFDGQKLEIWHEAMGDNGFIRHLEGETKDLIWGVQNWVPYIRRGKSIPTFSNHKDAWFWVPTVNYFFSLPFRIQQAPVRSWAGTRQLGSTSYNLVYATWISALPSPKVDQYLLWIRTDTNILDYVQYTVRDFGKSIAGTVWYTDYKSVQGIAFPHKVALVDAPGKTKDFLHYFKVESVQFGKQPPLPLVPEPGKRQKKYKEM